MSGNRYDPPPCSFEHEGEARDFCSCSACMARAQLARLSEGRDRLAGMRAMMDQVRARREKR